MRPRSFRIDNAKAILIFLVVWGHFIEFAAFADGMTGQIYAAVYAFHMPAFALLSGYVSMAEFGREFWARLARRLLLPLVVFQLLYWPFLTQFAPFKLGGFVTPHWILWFLASLATWKLMLPIFARIRFPLASAFALALVAGFIPEIDTTFSLSRTFYFFPAFLFGHLYASEALARLQNRERWCAAGFAVIVISVAWSVDGTNLVVLFGSQSYGALPEIWASPVFDRLLLMASGIGASTLLIALIPERKSAISSIGLETLTIYLLHGFAAVFFWKLSALVQIEPGAGFLILAAAASALVTFVLAFLAKLATPGLRKAAV